jgi:hypothetical protein
MVEPEGLPVFEARLGDEGQQNVGGEGRIDIRGTLDASPE